MIYTAEQLIETLFTLKLQHEWSDQYIADQLKINRVSIIRIRQKRSASLIVLAHIAAFLKKHGKQVTGFIRKNITYRSEE